MDYIARNLGSSDDVYTLAIASYALQLAQHNAKDYILQTFDSRAINKGMYYTYRTHLVCMKWTNLQLQSFAGGLKWWEKPIPKSDERNTWYKQPNSINIEISAYGLLAFLEAGHINDGLPVLKWLLSQRNDRGGFTSTQDTIVGLQALASYAENIASPSNNVEIQVKYNEGIESRINVNRDNAMMIQKYEVTIQRILRHYSLLTHFDDKRSVPLQLPKSVRQINVTATGRGFALLQFSYKYNTNVTGAWPRFSLDPQLNKNSNPHYLHLTVCTK